MRIVMSNSPLARACVIASVLVCVKAAPAANSRQNRTAPAPQTRTSSYAEAGPTDPSSASPTTQAKSSAATSSNTAVPSAQLSNPAKSASTDSAAASRSAGTSSLASVERGASLSKELWASRVVAPELPGDAQDSLALRRLIRQVRSVKFSGTSEEPASAAPAGPAREAASSPMQPTVEAQQPASAVGTSVASASSPAGPSLSGKAKKTLDTLQQNPDQVHDALDVAELLFLSGRATDAAPFYAKALDQISRTDSSYDADRAWILFQLGNSLRETDITKAQDAYMKLVSEYPSSPWTELAKAHGRLLTWYQKSRPEVTPTSPQL